MISGRVECGTLELRRSRRFAVSMFISSRLRVTDPPEHFDERGAPRSPFVVEISAGLSLGERVIRD